MFPKEFGVEQLELTQSSTGGRIINLLIVATIWKKKTVSNGYRHRIAPKKNYFPRNTVNAQVGRPKVRKRLINDDGRLRDSITKSATAPRGW